MAKTNISMPDSMLEDVDHRAAQAGVTRSGFVQEAIAHYGVELDAAKALAERAARIDGAIASARDIATRVPADADGTAIIRGMRDASPAWLDRRDDE